MFVTRPPLESDVLPLAALLNAIIAAGGTTAHETPFSTQSFAAHFLDGPEVLSAQVVLRDAVPIGFQTLSHHPELPKGWADIASFTRRDDPVPGAGRALFAASLLQAQALDLGAINATIRADNAGGLRFYRGLGFELYDRSPAVPLADGRPVDRLHHRYDIAQS